MSEIEVLEVAFWCCISVLVYTYVAFPLCMELVSRTATKQLAPQEVLDWPRVTMIIPAYNESMVIDSKVRNSLALDYPANRLQIIVACDGCTDDTLALVQAFDEPRVTPLAFPARRGKAAVVNDAAQQATGSILCLSDANVMAETNALKALVASLADQKIGAVSADVRLQSENSSFGAGESFYYTLERSIQEGESKISSMIGVDGGMYAIRRSCFSPIPHDTILDDFCISMNVINQGRRVIYNGKAVAHESATESAVDEFRRRIRISTGAVQAIFRGTFPSLRYPISFWLFCSHKLVRWISPVFLVAVMVLSVPLVYQRTEYWIPLAMELGILTLAAIGWGSRKLRWSRWFGIPFYFGLSQLAMLWGLLKGLCANYDSVWERTPRSALLTSDGTDLEDCRSHR